MDIDLNMVVWGFASGFLCSMMGWVLVCIINACDRALHPRMKDKWE